MKWQHNDTDKFGRGDGAGTITVTIETEQDAKWWIKYHQRDLTDPREVVAFLEGVPHVIEKEATGFGWDERGAFYECSAELGREWSQPYREWLERLTGYTGELSDIELPAGQPLTLWNIVTRFHISEGVFCADGFQGATDNEKRDAATSAARTFLDQLRRDVGRVKHEPEYIPTRNGLYKRNPDCLKIHPPQPGIEWTHGGRPMGSDAAGICRALWAWWLENAASEKQRDYLARDLSNKHYRDDAPWPNGGLYIADPDGKCNWDGKGTKATHITMSDFAQA